MDIRDICAAPFRSWQPLGRGAYQGHDAACRSNGFVEHFLLVNWSNPLRSTPINEDGPIVLKLPAGNKVKLLIR